MTEPDRLRTDALRVRRSYTVDTDRLAGVVVEVDAARVPGALAVLQAGLHDPTEGLRLVFGYEVTTAGLGAWVGDRTVRLRIWPAMVDADGAITDDSHGQADGDVLVIDLDPGADADALDVMVRTGRVIVACPDAGPIPLVVDIDRPLLADAVATASSPHR